MYSNIAVGIKQQLVSLNVNIYPVYSYKLYKTINFYIRYIRLRIPKTKHALKNVLVDLFEIKRLLISKLVCFKDYDSLENIREIIVATIISVVHLQLKFKFINATQSSNYIKTALKS
jgi:hypothetical protein